MTIDSNRTIDISFATLLKIALAGLLFYVVYQVLDILGIIVVAVILATALDPAVDWLQRYRIPRAISLVIIYLILFLVIGGIILLLVPPLAHQMVELAKSFPYYYSRLMSGVVAFEGTLPDQAAATLQQALQSLGVSLAEGSTSILSSIASIFGGLISFVITLVITFYLVVEEQGLKKLVTSLVPAEHHDYAADLLNRIQDKLGAWLRGQLLLMLIIGVMTYIGLIIFGMPYALVLALLAGLTEVIAYVGPILGAIPAVLIAFSISPFKALLIIALYTFIQQTENNIIVPSIMKRSIGLNPIISILAIMVGYNIAGVIGAVVSIPVAAIIALILSDIFDKKAVS